ncbi:uncharacterized protein LOC143559751 [Bidens hawaiensis]|uniref:uncharacterized protein LOC143559751 n=1 Tax=Bidens hawaiensis TaxID=980011 RepID=UPI004049F5B6
MAGNVDRERKWIIDSGATEHFTYDDSILKNITTRNFKGPVTIPNGASIPVEGRGDCTLSNGMTIKNVLHVPDFKCNLLTVSKISNDLQCVVTFFPSFCVMQDLHSKALIGAGECLKGLYKIGTMGKERQAMMTTVNTWHKRLGHASISKLNDVSFIKGVSLNSKGVCDACVKAKFARLPFQISTTKTSACFELIHCDIWEDVYPFTNVDVPKDEEEVFIWPKSWDDEPAFKPQQLNEANEIPSDSNVIQEPTAFPHEPIENCGISSPHATNLEEMESPQAENQRSNENSSLGPITEDDAVDNEPEFFERPKRNRTNPSYLKDYDVKLPPSLNQEHSSSSSNQEPSTLFLAAITSNNEPKYYGQAVKNPKWIEAMKTEIKALEENGTWTLEELPKGKHVIDSKWVYKIKYKPSGEIERYKARLVAKGFTQTEGIDYHDTFAPVAKLVTVRTLLAVAIKQEWHIHQLNVNNAFLHGDLHEEVYMKIPQGFGKHDDNRKERVFVAALIYVDDVIITGNDINTIKETKHFLDKEFSIRDLGPLKFFLGIEVARTKRGLVLSQRKYTLDILEDTGMLGCRPSLFPMEQNLKLDKRDGEARVNANQYRRLAGRLLYLQATRPDITYSVNVLSQFVSDPCESHLEAANHVLRYLKATPGQGILLNKDGEINLTAYCDSDWLGCSITRRLRIGYLLLLGGAPISWKSKRQSVVSRSSAEAEYRELVSIGIDNTIFEKVGTEYCTKSIDTLIFAAIEAADSKKGANKSSISKQIESTYGSLPAAHSTLLSHHLNKLKATGELIVVKNNYVKPDPNAPPRRGRGRPPKPKSDDVSDTKQTVVRGRKRGRPAKLREEGDSAPAPPTGEKRGRGIGNGN